MSKKPFIELEKHLVIGIGSGSLTLGDSRKSNNYFQEWLCIYRQIADSHISTDCFIPTQVLRELLKVERLQKDYKAAYEYGRRAKVLNAELENQLAEAERKRDVANRVNLESFNELQAQLVLAESAITDIHNELHIKTQQLSKCEDRVITAQEINRAMSSGLKHLEFENLTEKQRNDKLQNRLIYAQGLLHVKSNELVKCKKDFAQLDSLIQTTKDELEEITARQAKLRYHNLIGFKTAIILLAIVVFQMFIIF